MSYLEGEILNSGPAIQCCVERFKRGWSIEGTALYPPSLLSLSLFHSLTQTPFLSCVQTLEIRRSKCSRGFLRSIFSFEKLQENTDVAFLRKGNGLINTDVFLFFYKWKENFCSIWIYLIVVYLIYEFCFLNFTPLLFFFLGG